MERHVSFWTRDRRSLALALALHAGLFLVVRTSVVRETPLGAQNAVSGTSADEIELDVSDAPSGRAPEASVDELPARRDTTSPPATRARQASNAAVAPGPVTPDEAATELGAAEAEQAPLAVAPEGTPGPIDLGLGPNGWQKWLSSMPKEQRTVASREPRAPVVRAPPVSSTGGLQEGLEKHDQTLGLSPAGRVATALYQAAHGDDAPETGAALFNVTVLRTGVVEVSLSSSSDKRWQAVADRAAEALRRSPPRIPPPRDGYRLTLRLVAEEQMPNGVKRKQLHGPRLKGVPPGFRDLKAARRDVELKNPTLGVGPDRQDIQGSPIGIDLPGVFVSGQGKVCNYMFGITPLGLALSGGCDPANAAAKLQRVVRTEVQEQTAF